MKVNVLDLGVGNLLSLANALDRLGVQVVMTDDPRQALRGDALVIPGVGAFGAAASRLGEHVGEVHEALAGGLPCLGICLGMQLLFEGSAEAPEASGIGLLPGTVRPLQAERTPQMGWNRVVWRRGGEFGDDLADGVGNDYVYYANGYVAPDGPWAVAHSAHESDRFPAVIRHARTWGTQFHPEKSGGAGQRLLAAFVTDNVEIGRCE